MAYSASSSLSSVENYPKKQKKQTQAKKHKPKTEAQKALHIVNFEDLSDLREKTTNKGYEKVQKDKLNSKQYCFISL